MKYVEKHYDPDPYLQNTSSGKQKIIIIIHSYSRIVLSVFRKSGYVIIQGLS